MTTSPPDIRVAPSQEPRRTLRPARQTLGASLGIPFTLRPPRLSTLKTLPDSLLDSLRGVRSLLRWPMKLSLRSLRVQMALGSAVIAFVAVLLVAAIALVSVTAAFNVYERGQLVSEVGRMATALGQGQLPTLKGSSDGSGDPFAALTQRASGSPTVWIMDATGRVGVGARSQESASAALRDQAAITAALRNALRGQPSEGTLAGTALPPLTQRLYAAAPVYLSGDDRGPIIGAVALSTPLHADRAATFAISVSRAIVLLALLVACIAAFAAAVLSGRVIRPLARLTTATERMAGGDYAARVAIASPDELRSLATSFNEMAAALERDVGELHRQEQQRRELVANVSHELATPLTAIQGFTEALLDEVVHEPAARRDTTRLIAREAARLRRLVDQLRQVALFEAGAQVLDRGAVQLPVLVAETLAVLAPEIERKGQVVVDELPPDLPAVDADADRLTEILLNLLDNALRHTPSGGRIDVTGAVEGRFVRVTVADSGPGIAPADRQRIFERFYRVDRSRSTATGGSGLGLAIVRALVEAHGGTIRAEDRPGGGTQLSFTLPIYR